MESYPVFTAENVNSCRICGFNNFVELINLGMHPPSNSFIEKNIFDNEKSFPLIVLVCKICNLAQLSIVVSQKEVFNKYAYRTSSSKALQDSFKDLALDAFSILASQNSNRFLIYDIGCNDGLSLSMLSREDITVIGVEPSNAALLAIGKGFKVVNEFFTKDLSLKLLSSYGKSDLITVSNVLAHVPNILDFIEGVRNLMHDEGVWIIEFPYLFDMIERLSFDVIYHEHLSYLSILPLERALNKFDLTIFNIKRKEVGGSGPHLRVFVKHKTNFNFKIDKSVIDFMKREEELNIISIANNGSFSKAISKNLREIRNIVFDLKAKGFNVGGFGAPAKGNTLLNALDFDSSIISFIADNTIEKIGLYTPGSHILIISDNDFISKRIDFALLLSWNYLDFFVGNSDFFKGGGKFILPFPSPKILERTIL